jgi:PKD repeat protein
MRTTGIPALSRTLVAAALTVAALTLGTPAASAAVPANDDFANAVVVSTVPFGDSVDVSEATAEVDEPQWCNYVGRSVWYAITPAEAGVFRADTGGSDFYDTALHLYRQDGAGLGGLSFIGCWDYSSPAQFSLEGGRTYYLQAGRLYGGGGTLQVNVQEVSAPANDDFADATPIPGLPFSDVVDTSAATTEAGEPVPACGYGLSNGSAWYAFTPSESGSISAASSAYYSEIAAYTGSSVSGLTSVGCAGPWGGRLTFHADAGTTYYFQVGTIFGETGPFTFALDVAPAPQPGFWLSPGDPSQYDTVQFVDQSNDPGGVGIQSESWSFGDGTGFDGFNPTHRYAADGDYTVRLDVTTYDGRTASLEQTVSVRTHDVAIVKLGVPQSASAGQTRSITVGLTDTRHPETVEVQLFKSTLNPYDPFELVGTLRQYVPVRSGGRTTNLAFSYTFTADDAAIGKVTFKAVATIVGGRDASPADNTAIALPTKVSR